MIVVHKKIVASNNDTQYRNTCSKASIIKTQMKNENL